MDSLELFDAESIHIIDKKRKIFEFFSQSFSSVQLERERERERERETARKTHNLSLHGCRVLPHM